jgi:hypothetical protein
MKAIIRVLSFTYSANSAFKSPDVRLPLSIEGSGMRREGGVAGPGMTDRCDVHHRQKTKSTLSGFGEGGSTGGSGVRYWPGSAELSGAG